jgi:hypothetical protein
VREIPVSGIRHPLADQLHETYVVTESRAPIVFLTAARANLLRTAGEAGLCPVLVTDELSCLTPAFAEVWRTGGGAWVVRGAGGRLREGFTGRTLDQIGDVLAAAPMRGPEDIDPGYLRPTVVDSIEVLVTTSLRHRASPSTLLGGSLAALAPFVGAGEPELWSAYEPTGTRWDREGLTGFVRNRMPADTLVVATAPGLVGTITARRTTAGVEEITEARLSVGTPSTVAFEVLLNRLHAYLAELVELGMPLVGVVLARPGRSDLLIPPLLQHPPSPLALLIGPPGVRSFGLDVDDMVTRFQARPVGRPRIPGLLFGLGTIGVESWARLDALLTALGPEQVHALLGPAQRTVDVLRPRGDDAE